MVYISIGAACNVTYQIGKHRHRGETLFFDWLITSMLSVIEILGCNNIDRILYSENIVRDANTPLHKGMSRTIIKSLDSCISIHDISSSFSDEDRQDFINKYKRRYYRIIQYIKSEKYI